MHLQKVSGGAGEIVKLNDSITIMNQRLSRIFEMTSDIEFRVLRVEKAGLNPAVLSDGDIANELVQQDTVGLARRLG